MFRKPNRSLAPQKRPRIASLMCDLFLAHVLPVFDAADGATIVGMALPRETVRAAFSNGAAEVFGADAARFDLTRPLPDAEQIAREAMQFDAHCAAMPEDLMPGMVEAQRLRDAHFAKVALQTLETYGRPVVVIVGKGHVRTDWGMPVPLAAAAPEVSVYAFAFTEGDQSDLPLDGQIATAAPARDDPCAAFRK